MTEPLHRDKDATWQKDAACIGLPTDWFFPERGGNVRGPDSGTAQARAVCRRCPVRARCAEYAMTEPVERIGLWGGMTPVERGHRVRRLR